MVSGKRLKILHRERVNMVFGKRPARLLQNLHHGSFFVQVRRRGEPSSAISAIALHQQDRLRPVIFVRLPKSQGSVSKLFFIQFLIMFSEFLILLCLTTSTIELFMLDLIIFMIYLFQNLIIKLPNISKKIKVFKSKSKHKSFFFKNKITNHYAGAQIIMRVLLACILRRLELKSGLSCWESRKYEMDGVLHGSMT